ncbi:hypothetical protein OE88DRAFT_1665321 [Heliocybe sulcata]|uniref:Uncharacterized protein n=1 Tax=Heliocybe sulcata TaxID=5364 RepID=A0A5C3MSI5_9AGAM|nr:hypothetical protein OE88DRAFT_1665321 [Heliocybe sulcata]
MLDQSPPSVAHALGSPCCDPSPTRQESSAPAGRFPVATPYRYSPSYTGTAALRTFGEAPLLEAQGHDPLARKSEDEQTFEADNASEEAHTAAPRSARLRRYRARCRRRIESKSPSTEGSTSGPVSDIDCSSQSSVQSGRPVRVSEINSGRISRKRSSATRNRKRKSRPRRPPKSLAQRMFTAAVLAHVDLPEDAVYGGSDRRPLKFTAEPEIAVLSPDNEETQRKPSTSSWRRPVLFPVSDFSAKRQFLNAHAKPLSHWSIQPRLGQSDELSGNCGTAQKTFRSRAMEGSSRMPLKFVPARSEADDTTDFRPSLRNELLGRRRLGLRTVSLPQAGHMRPPQQNPGVETQHSGASLDVKAEEPDIQLDSEDWPVFDLCSATEANDESSFVPLDSQRDVNDCHDDTDGLEVSVLLDEPADASLRTAMPPASVQLSGQQERPPASLQESGCYVEGDAASKPLRPLASFFEEFIRTAREVSQEDPVVRVQDNKKGSRKRRRTMGA